MAIITIYLIIKIAMKFFVKGKKTKIICFNVVGYYCVLCCFWFFGDLFFYFVCKIGFFLCIAVTLCDSVHVCVLQFAPILHYIVVYAILVIKCVEKL